MDKLVERLATELERPRELSPQVLRHIVGTYGIEDDAVGSFLADSLPKLEDYEHDLILSPLFTPKLADQAIFAELLGADSIPKEQWPALIQRLAARPTTGQLVTSDSVEHAVMLREVTIERYVYRLRLDGAVSGSVFQLLGEGALSSDGPTLKAVARRAIWESPAREAILERYLSVASGEGLYSIDDAVQLLRVMEDYKPKDAADLLSRIPPWQEGLRQDIRTAAEGKPFFNDRVQAEHGGDRDRRSRDNLRLEAKKGELEFLDRLQRILARTD